MSPVHTAGPIERVLVLVPTYNEVDNLERIVRRIRSSVPDADVLVIDDNSPDGTGDLADKLAEADARVRVLHRAGKEGLGKAYLAGFAWGLERDYDALVEIDADGSHPAEVLPRMIAAAADADLVIGSRWMKGGSVVNWPKSRELLSRGANLYVRAALGTAVRDATAGFRVYRAETLRTIDVQSVTSQGYGFQIDLTWRTLRAGLTIVEIPIQFVEREIGVSKMSGNIISEAFLAVAAWGAEHRLAQARALLERRAS
ncbi:polyprenol monophosphomannose synthase [Calidifontibacter sp. DB0510]|uniref:Polyprenol monophosphomannose synthase n=1 Tax=Metallococcus carri TaxID=1656884 RepID=A0A967B355_9MICO|nr:polyprenol monophosphomannose synthase [Metallococcus carri]NHN54792.1 polyprenol monophosphomannose synthase [Metallococcus carri]NOP37137.1 polyprenol monophosphomannose synthase [Calidifontibacter sp. DB2511S]